MISVVLTLLALPSHAPTQGPAAVALMALGWLAWHWTRSRRARRAHWLGEVTDALAIMAVLAVAPTSATVLALPSSAIFLRTLTPGVAAALARLGLYLGAVFVGVFLGAHVGEDRMPVGTAIESAGTVVLQGLSGLVFLTAFTSLLGTALDNVERSAERERLLTACGLRLIAAASRAEVLHEAAATARLLAGTSPDVRARVMPTRGPKSSRLDPGGRKQLVLRLPEGGSPDEWALEVSGPRRRAQELSRSVAVLAQQVQLTMDRCTVQEQLREQAETDWLTGLATRQVLGRALDDATAEVSQRAAVGPASDGRKAVVVIVDCDDFKGVNDTFGHLGGDAVLLEVAKRLRSATGTGDVVARLGGDEFAVLLRPEKAGPVRERVDRLVDLVNAPFELGGRELLLSCSVGSADVVPGTTAEVVLHAADTAMYAAKRSGKGRLVVSDGAVGGEPPHLGAGGRARLVTT